jgi:glucose/arabinose dehydrogenase/mono/diheme cytochrome c family protein
MTRLHAIIRNLLQPGIVFGLLAIVSCKEHADLIGDPDNGGLLLPEGFSALVVKDSLGPARHMAVNTNGDIYVKLRFAKKGDGGNVALRDINKDGKADSIVYFGNYDTDGSLSNLMRIHKGYLYFGSELVIYRQQLEPGKLVPTTPMETVFTDDHAHGTHWHITKPIAFDEQDRLYIPFGAPSNACQDLVRTPGGTPGIAGQDPCPELIDHGGVWQFPANRLNLTQKDGKRYATGLRSIVAMTWNTQDQHLYLVMHGRDDLHLLWPEKYSPWQSAVLPAEEFFRVDAGQNFGWPYSYYDQFQGKNVLAPEYGGDGLIPARDSSVQLPLIGFPAHWAPNDLLFYQGSQFPERYRHGAFIAFHGSTNRTPYPQSGYFVCFIPFTNGKPSGPWEVFADGFAGRDTIVNVSDAKYRPMGLAEGPDGSLYVVDSRKGKLWRILFRGDREQFGPAQLAAMEKQKTTTHIRNPDVQKDNLFRETGLPGAQVYNYYCSSCHQHDGKGDGNRFPPLAQSDWVTGDRNRLINVILNGLNQPVTVSGKTYNSLMPQHSFLKDAEIAQVLTYLKQHFNSSKDSVTAAEVTAVRTKQILPQNANHEQKGNH